MYKSSIFLLLITISLNIKAQNKPFEPIQNQDGWNIENQLLGNRTIEKMDSLITTNEFKEISSVVIAHNGKVIFENYYNENTSETKHNTRSCTKTITGTLIGTLIQDGSIKSVNENASKFSKVKNLQNPDNRKDKITIEDLLTMSSMLECNDWEQDSRGKEDRMYLIEDWVKFYWDLPIKGFPEWVTKPKDSKYGRSFSYCTAGVVVLGDVINNISDSLENYADKALFSKLGITDYHWQMTPTGIPMTGGGLGLKSRDLLKIGQLYLNNGKWNNEQIISAEFVNESTKPKAEVGMFDYEYGYLWWLSEFGTENKEKAYFMSGTGGSKIVVLPKLDLVVVLTSTYFNGGMESHNQTTKLLDEYIVPEIKKLKK
jgi:CubicO group peptidase (beta-lactamase class C family)